MISENFQRLFDEAKKVRENAHVPYSSFKVGAAFLTEDNKIITGCNVENAAYPQSQCAEASAIGSLISEGFSSIKEVVVIGSGKLLCSPCGGCRQRLREFASLDVHIHMCNSKGHLQTSTLGELLPIPTTSFPPLTNNILALPLDSTLKSKSSESSFIITAVSEIVIWSSLEDDWSSIPA